MADTVRFAFGENWQSYATTSVLERHAPAGARRCLHDEVLAMTPEDAAGFVTARGFVCRRSVSGSRIGVFGTGCDEYLFLRGPEPSKRIANG